jgi:hypothetical protein
VLRKHLGEAITGMACPMENILDSPTTEALALLKGSKVVDQLGCSSIVVESEIN